MFTTIEDPETGTIHVVSLGIEDKGIELSVMDKETGEPRAIVYLDVFGGKVQVLINDEKDMAETGGDQPQTVVLFEEQEEAAI